MKTWIVSPTSTAPNSLITISVVSPNFDGKVKFAISCPNDTQYIIEGDIVNGIAVLQALLNSGEGVYNIVAMGDCDTIAPQSIAVYATCCVPSSGSAPALTLTIPSSKIIGQPFTAVVTGGIPNKLVTLIFDSQVLTMNLNNSGSGSIQLVGTVAGSYNIVAVQEPAASAVRSMTIVPSVNAATSLPNPPPACNFPLTMVSKLSRPTIPTGTNATLTLVVYNENSGTLNYTLPELTLPAGLSSPTAIKLTNEPIPAHTSREFNFVISGVNSSATVETIALVFPPHTYQCDGATYTVASSNLSIVVLPAAQSCGVEVTAFTATPTTIISGAKTTLTLTVHNLGSGSITQLSLNPVSLPAALGGGTIDFNNVTLAGGASYTYTKEVTTSNTTGSPISAVVYIPANRITCVCEGHLLTDDEAHTVSVLVNP